MMELLISAFQLALWVTFVVEFIRACPWPKRWLSVKPLSCDVCMTGWALIAVAHWELVQGTGWLTDARYPIAGAFALLLLALLKHWRGLSLLPPE